MSDAPMVKKKMRACTRRARHSLTHNTLSIVTHARRHVACIVPVFVYDVWQCGSIAPATVCGICG